MSKELYIVAVEELMAEGLSYEQASDRAYDRMRDRLADRADAAKQRAKDEGNWPLKKQP